MHISNNAFNSTFSGVRHGFNNKNANVITNISEYNIFKY